MAIASTLRARKKDRRWFWSPLTMVVVALLLRLAVMSVAYRVQMDPAQDHWTFGWENGRIARSIVTGHGFSSPYPEPSGPTALIPPVYAYLLAGVFKVFGIYTTAAAVAILTLNNLFSSLTCLPVFLIARRVFGIRVAVWAGWGWAFFPYDMFLSNRWIWETMLTMLLLTTLVWMTLYLQDTTSALPWIAYGLLWGVAALCNPATLSTLPFLGGWTWLRHWRKGGGSTRAAALASLCFFMVVIPWIWHSSRNYGRFVAFRNNFGLEFLVGNEGDGRSPSWIADLPDENHAEMIKVEKMGEPAYLAEKQHEAREWFAHHSLQCTDLTLRRILYNWTGFWNLGMLGDLDPEGLPHVVTYSLISLLAFTGVGFAIRARRAEAVPLIVLLIFFPLVYYITHLDERFRHPIDPVIVILAVYGSISLRRRRDRINWQKKALSPEAVAAYPGGTHPG